VDLIHSHQYSDHLSELPTTIFLVISYLLYSYLLQSQYNQNNSLVLLCILVLFLSLSSCGICIAIFAHYYNIVKVFFWTNTENFLLLTQIRILSKFLISLSKMCTSSPKKLIKFTQISRIVWTFAKKLKSVKILKTFTHVITFTLF
jgi:hypothetical protein